MSQTVASPCVSVCRMHDPTGLCTGCARTLDEIACWTLLDDAERRAVWHELPARRIVLQRLGVYAGLEPT